MVGYRDTSAPNRPRQGDRKAVFKERKNGALSGHLFLPRSSKFSFFHQSKMTNVTTDLLDDGQEHPDRAKVGVVGDVGLARDDGHALEPRQRDGKGNANVGADPK